jgi:glycosyltransferase involved in cell wall biosynthesis
MSRRVTMGLLFYPRGGSAQVIKYLAAALRGEDWATELVCGSLGEPGERTHAETFFDGMDVRAMDFSPAVEAYRRGEDPIAFDPPMHPSFEDRPDVPDRVFSEVSPELGDHLVDAWARHAEGIGPEMLHLHHLSPLQEAFARVAPETPLVTHLHGTDLKMIDRIDNGEDDGPHAKHWAERLRAAAGLSDRFLVISPHDRDEAKRLLGADAEWIPNGVDTDLFDREPLGHGERLERWREWLVEDARGWDESGVPGSISYTEQEIEALADPEAPVLLFVGRFLDFKRVPMLVRAYAAARERFERRAPLVIWGGFPGEWEGEHPHTVASWLRVPDVFFAGWRGHTDLARGLPCCDVMVAPSHNEPFGQVFLEAMAAGVPVIATKSGGPLSFVNTEEGSPNGWLVGVDDEAELADAIVEGVNEPAARRERSDNAYEQIRANYSWRGLAPRFTAAYEEAAARHRPPR